MSIPVFNPFWDGEGPKRKQDWKRNYNRRKKKGTHLGWKWWKLRQEWLMLHPYCTKCANFATEVHHIKPRHTHPELTYDLRNLMSLCKECHRKEHIDE